MLHADILALLLAGEITGNQGKIAEETLVQTRALEELGNTDQALLLIEGIAEMVAGWRATMGTLE
jgi:hypothetical protein